MLQLLADMPSSDGLRVGLLATAFGFGLRHGVDWDHIAAITDITSADGARRESLPLATMYAFGHAFVVLALGILAVVFAQRLPSGVDPVMERLVGVTLVLLGAYVFYGLLRHGRAFRMSSRWMLLFRILSRASRSIRRHLGSSDEPVVIEHEHAHMSGGHHASAEHMPVEWSDTSRLHDVGIVDRRSLPVTRSATVATTRTHRHRHRHVALVPDDPFRSYGKRTSFVVGMIHGIGAETPTQILIFVTSADSAGKGAGVVLLTFFVAGLLVSNTGVALAATYGRLGASANSRAYVALSIAIAGLSVVLGALFLFGRSSVLPGIFTT